MTWQGQILGPQLKLMMLVQRFLQRWHALRISNRYISTFVYSNYSWPSLYLLLTSRGTGPACISDMQPLSLTYWASVVTYVTLHDLHSSWNITQSFNPDVKAITFPSTHPYTVTFPCRILLS